MAGVFVREHAQAVALYNDVIVLYDEEGGGHVKGLYEIVSDQIEYEIRTIRIRHKKLPIPKTSYFLYLWSIFKTFRKLISKGWRPDIIHAHVYSAGVPAVILGKIYKIPVVITEHWSGFPRHILRMFDILRARFAMNRAKIILPVSNDLEEAIKSYDISLQIDPEFNAVWRHNAISLFILNRHEEAIKYYKLEYEKNPIDTTTTEAYKEFLKTNIEERLEELKARAMTAQGYLFLGELFADAGKKDVALENLRKAEAMYLEMKVTPRSYWLARTREALDRPVASVYGWIKKELAILGAGSPSFRRCHDPFFHLIVSDQLPVLYG